MTPLLDGDRLVVDLGRVHRCLSTALLGGGAGRVRTWINLQVSPGYARTDPARHLAAVSADLGAPVVGMMTAAPVRCYAVATAGGCTAVATAGVRHAMAAAATRPRAVPPLPAADPCRPGTINLLVVCEVPLAPAALVNALTTVVEAKSQALAAARIPARNADGFATGTATDAVCVACPPGRGERFAGPATRIGADVGLAVYDAVVRGIARAAAAQAPGAHGRGGNRGAVPGRP